MAQLINVADGFHLWSEKYDRELEDIFAIQDDIANSIVEKLKITLLANSQKLFTTKNTNSVDAYQHYLKGRHDLDQRQYINRAIESFEKALNIDPDYALAWAGMGYAHFYQIVFSGYAPKKTFPLARQAARKALELNPQLAEAYLIEGITYFYFNWDFSSAEKCYLEAIRLAPQMYDVYRVKAYFHSMMREFPKAIDLANKAVGLDPLNLNAKVSLGEILFRAGEYYQAIEVLNNLISQAEDYGMAYYILGNCYYQLGDTIKALEIIEKGENYKNVSSYFMQSKEVILAENGDLTEALITIKKLEDKDKAKWMPPTLIALLHFAVGNDAQARAFIQTALQEKDPILMMINVDPTYAKYRHDVSIQHALKTIGIIK